MKTYGQLC